MKHIVIIDFKFGNMEELPIREEDEFLCNLFSSKQTVRFDCFIQLLPICLLIQLFQICYIHYLTMKKIIALAFLVLALSAIESQQTHQQAKPTATPAPTTPTAATIPVNNKPSQAATTPAPIKIQRQPHKEPGHEATPGNPFGRDPSGHRTCFQPPCYDPVGPCTIPTTKAATRRPVSKAGTKTAKTSTPAQAPVVAPPKQGTWKAVIYVVRFNGKLAKYAGYRCV